MTERLPAALLLVFALFTATATASLEKEIDGFITEGMAQWNAPGLAVSVVSGGDVILAKGYGLREAGKPEAVDADTLFAIGSTTKAFTAAALGLLADRGKLTWESRVADLWPGFALSDPWVTREIRVSDLLANRSGLGAISETLWYGTDLSREEVIHRLADVPFDTGFRYTFQYRNVMFLCAGELIPRVDGRSWEQFLQEELFNPLHMARTFATEAGIDARENVARPHVIDYSGAPLPIAYRAMGNIAPAGSIVSTAADMAQWLKLQLGCETYGLKTILTPQTLATLHQSHTPLSTGPNDKKEAFPPTELSSYALGWVTESYRGQRIVWHNGGIDGMSAWVGFVPGQQFGVAILTNLDDCDLRRAIFFRLVDRLLAHNAETAGAPKLPLGDLRAPLAERFHKNLSSRNDAEQEWQKARKKQAAPELPREAYTGRYRHPIAGDLEVILNSDGTLSARRSAALRLDLAVVEKNSFSGKFTDPATDLRNGKTSLVFTVKDGKATEVLEDGLIAYTRVP